MTAHIQTTDMNAGVYIHIPFCIQKCPYCDFYSITDLSLKRDFLDALLKEIQMNQNAFDRVDTIYIGGGTPSVLDGKDISLILESLAQSCNLHENPEITIEVNPGTVDIEKLKIYKAVGVNRLNIGVQSFNVKNLMFLGRIHSKDEAVSVIQQARDAGFDNIGLDLMYGLPDQTADTWMSDLQTTIDFNPQHLSCYMLTYEKHTPMWKNVQNRSLRPLPEHQVAKLFDTTIRFLETHGYKQYEISNFAKSSSESIGSNRSRHNQKYWSSVPYLGLGPSAHSFIEPKRYWNVRSVKEYIHRLSKGIRPVEEEEILTVEQLMTEAIYLGLRTTKGININTFSNKFNRTFTGMFDSVILDLKPQ